MSHPLTGPVRELISNRQCELGLSDADLCKMLGFDTPTALRLIKAGHMTLPITCVAALARALELPPDELLELHLRERSPQVLQAIHDCFGASSFTPHERRLLQTIRELSAGMRTSIFPFRANGMTAVIAVDEDPPEGPLVSQASDVSSEGDAR